MHIHDEVSIVNVYEEFPTYCAIGTYACKPDGSIYVFTGTNWIMCSASEYSNDSNLEKQVPTNCINCGAPLFGECNCRYCGTRNLFKEVISHG